MTCSLVEPFRSGLGAGRAPGSIRSYAIQIRSRVYRRAEPSIWGQQLHAQQPWRTAETPVLFLAAGGSHAELLTMKKLSDQAIQSKQRYIALLTVLSLSCLEACFGRYMQILCIPEAGRDEAVARCEHQAWCHPSHSGLQGHLAGTELSVTIRRAGYAPNSHLPGPWAQLQRGSNLKPGILLGTSTSVQRMRGAGRENGK